MAKVRQLEQRDWDQLLTVASGYLPLTGGDLKQAMACAIAAHADLIRAVREEGVTTRVPRGKVTLFVPEEGGIALAFESNRSRTTEREPAAAAEPSTPLPDLGDLVLEVVEPSGYVTLEEDEDVDEERSPYEGDWPEVG